MSQGNLFDPPDRRVPLSTRRGRVLACLSRHKNEHVPGPLLCRPDIGGSEGLRRLRELRKEGHVIKKRPSPTGDGYEYMLIDG